MPNLRIPLVLLVVFAVLALSEANKNGNGNRWGEHHSIYDTKHVKASHYPAHKDPRHHTYHFTKDVKQHEKAAAKHAPLDIPHHEARIQSDLKTSWKKLRTHKDHWEREDLHLQDLSYDGSRHHVPQKPHHPKVHRPAFVDNVKHGSSLHHKDEVIEDHFYPHTPKKVSERKHESPKTHTPKSAHSLVKSLEHKPHLQTSKRGKEHKPRKQKKAYEKKQQQQHKKRYGKLHKSW